uniref:CCHC-type domain-containing protein n=1 Tax=Tanacetum cinerariifolium TaxID=118510 RepID=A0A6L2P347_TANCI|nr:hypothetical protein [Tanacetum cinerariifolium]
MLKQGDYEMWRLRIEKYFHVQDYALWDVIESGNSFVPVTQTTTAEDGAITTTISGPVTAKEKIKKKIDVKARSMLLMVLPNEHLLTFNQYKDAKSLFVAIETRSGGNEATKKTQKTLLKQMYKNFSATSTESLDYIFNRLQKIVIQLALLDDLEEMDSKWQLALLSMRFFQKTGKKITINGSDTAGFDKSKVECYSCHKMGHFTRGCRGPRNQDSRNRYQVSSKRITNVEEMPPKAMVAIDEGADNKDCSAESPVMVEKKTDVPTLAKVEVVRPKQQEKLVRKLVRYVEMYMSQVPRGNQRNWNNLKSQQLGCNFVMYNKAYFVCGSFEHVQANCNYHQRERVVSRNNFTRVNYNNSTRKTHPNAHKNMAHPKIIVNPKMKTGLRLANTDMPVNTAHPKTTVHCARPITCVFKSAQSTVKRPYQQRTVFTNKSFSETVNTCSPRPVNTTRPRPVNTTRPISAVVNAIKVNYVNVVKASKC